MNFFNFKRKKFEEEEVTEVKCIEVWIVEWNSIYHDIGRYWHPIKQYLPFVEREAAEKFVDDLKGACKLLKNDPQNIRIYKQIPPNNID